MSLKVDPETFDGAVLTDLFEAGILVFWMDAETKTTYPGLSPWARREFYQLPPPLGLFYLDFGVSKMTKKTPHEWALENAPSGRRDPVPERELTGIKEVDHE